MSNTLTVKVHIDDAFLDKQMSTLLDKRTMLELHNLFAKYMNPYVPFLEGPLSQTLEITPEYVKYTQPYAHYQYEGEGFNFTRDYHPRASAHWDQAMMAEKGDEFRAQIKEILMRRANELYG